MFKKTSSKVNEIEIVDEKVTFTNLTTDISEQKHGELWLFAKSKYTRTVLQHTNNRVHLEGWTSQNSRQQSCTIRSQQLAAPTSTSTCFGESSSSLTNVNSYPVGAKIIESIAMQSHPNDHENSSSKHHLSSDNLENDFHKRKRSEPIDDTFRPLDISEPRFMKVLP